MYIRAQLEFKEKTSILHLHQELQSRQNCQSKLFTKLRIHSAHAQLIRAGVGSICSQSLFIRSCITVNVKQSWLRVNILVIWQNLISNNSTAWLTVWDFSLYLLFRNPIYYIRIDYTMGALKWFLNKYFVFDIEGSIYKPKGLPKSVLDIRHLVPPIAMAVLL